MEDSEIIKNQATVNIGMIGHVANGKTSVVKAISGVTTLKYKAEHERNITIKLGYANAKIYKCMKCGKYTSSGSDVQLEECECKGSLELLRHVSFVDCPGHEILFSTMLNGVSVMDGAMILVAGNEKCPQPQTREHLAAMEIIKQENLIILQNKIDLVTKDECKRQYQDIKTFIHGSVAEKAPVIPISAQSGLNIDKVLEYIVKSIPVPVHDYNKTPRMIIIRSFDVNKPGTSIDTLKGGICGGSLSQGMLKLGQTIEVRPGLITVENGKFKCKPLTTKIVSLNAESNSLKYAVSGGLIGVGTLLDPTLTRADRMVGQIIGNIGELPPIYYELEISYVLLTKLLGTITENKVEKLQKDETLMMNIGSTSTNARILALKKDLAKILLTRPVCASIGDKITMSRKMDKHFRLIGWGRIRGGKECEI